MKFIFCIINAILVTTVLAIDTHFWADLPYCGIAHQNSSIYVQVEYPGNDNFTCVDNGVRTVSCDQCFSNKKCSGDDHWCSSHTCDPDSHCFCHMTSVVESVVGISGCNINMTEVEVSISLPPMIQVRLGVYEEVFPQPHYINVAFPPLGSQSKRESIIVQPLLPLEQAGISFFADIEDHDLIVRTMPLSAGLLTLRKHEWFYSSEIGGMITIALPLEVFVTSGYIYLEFNYNGSYIGFDRVWVTGESYCNFKDCIFCWDSFNNFQCLTWSYKVALILISFIVFLLIVTLMPALFWMGFWAITLVIWIVKTPFIILYHLWNSPIMSALASAGKWTIDKRKLFMAAPRAPDEEVLVRPQNNRRVDAARNRYLAFLILAGFIACSLACTSGVFIPAEVFTCIRTDESHETCSMTYTLTTTLQSVGAEMCATLRDANNSVVGVLNLKFKSQVDYIAPTYLYTTSCWTGHYESERRCAEADSCPADCEPSYSKVPKPPKLDDPLVINYPGLAGCDRSCGCVSCDCFSCNQACIFWGYGIVPDDGWLNVNEFGLRNSQPTLTVRLLDNPPFDVTLVGVDSIYGYFHFKIIGTLSRVDQDFASRKLIIADNNNIWLGFAADPNAPVAQGVGDIQGTSSSIITASPDAFKFAPAIAMKDVASKSVSFSFLPCGANALSNYPKLPTVFNGQYWFWDSNSGLLVADVTNPGAMLVTVESSQPITFSRVLNLVCPKFTVKSAEGCFNCSQGFVIVISARSVCKEGTATLSADAPYVILATTSLPLTLVSQDFTINGVTTKADNSWLLSLVAGSEVHNAYVDFTAVEVPVVDPGTNYTKGNGTTSSGRRFSLGDMFGGGSFFGEIGDFLDDVGKGAASWVMYMTFILIVLVVTGVLIFGGIAVLAYGKVMYETIMQIVRTPFKEKVEMLKDLATLGFLGKVKMA